MTFDSFSCYYQHHRSVVPFIRSFVRSFIDSFCIINESAGNYAAVPNKDNHILLYPALESPLFSAWNCLDYPPIYLIPILYTTYTFHFGTFHSLLRSARHRQASCCTISSIVLAGFMAGFGCGCRHCGVMVISNEDRFVVYLSILGRSIAAHNHDCDCHVPSLLL